MQAVSSTLLSISTQDIITDILADESLDTSKSRNMRNLSNPLTRSFWQSSPPAKLASQISRLGILASY
jgi:hypothetical protein